MRKMYFSNFFTIFTLILLLSCSDHFDQGQTINENNSQRNNHVLRNIQISIDNFITVIDRKITSIADDSLTVKNFKKDLITYSSMSEQDLIQNSENFAKLIGFNDLQEYEASMNKIYLALNELKSLNPSLSDDDLISLMSDEFGWKESSPYVKSCSSVRESERAVATSNYQFNIVVCGIGSVSCGIFGGGVGIFGCASLCTAAATDLYFAQLHAADVKYLDCMGM